mgnify:CR=1 FL=1
MTKSNQSDFSRLESGLAYTAATIVGVSLLTLIGVLIAGASGVHTLPVFLVWIPEVGLPLGMILIISLVAFSARNRRKNDK